MHTSATSIQVKLALVVDDSPSHRRMLRKLLEQEHYRVVTAENGQQGVEYYLQYQPDLVLMDIDMPVLNGYQAAEKIKKISDKTKLSPIVFITSLTQESVFLDSINAGGDGILIRPFSEFAFKAKIKAMQRLSDYYLQVKQLQLEQQHDAQLAEQLFSQTIEKNNYGLDKIKILKQPAEIFSGDIHLTALAPNGDIHVLLGDFTGHGLRSTIGALPLADTFRSMTKKGFSLLDIVKEINKRLYHLLPANVFLACTLVAISSTNGSCAVFNAGLPDGYLVDIHGNIISKFCSIHPALGILPQLLDGTKLVQRAVDSSQSIVLLSDGILEAENNVAEQYGQQRFEQILPLALSTNDFIEVILADLQAFCQSEQQQDDYSLVLVPCAWQTQHTAIEQSPYAEGHNVAVSLDQSHACIEPAWQWQMKIGAERLAKFNPIPSIMNQINELEEAGEHWQQLYTILTELYLNALDHGILQLDSSIKQQPDGFVRYFTEREQRLSELTNGYINIALSYYPLFNGGQLIIQVKDSGAGFDSFNYFKVTSGAMSSDSFSGRGIMLVQQLCDTIEYAESGSLVKASFVWSQ